MEGAVTSVLAKAYGVPGNAYTLEREDNPKIKAKKRKTDMGERWDEVLKRYR